MTQPCPQSHKYNLTLLFPSTNNIIAIKTTKTIGPPLSAAQNPHNFTIFCIQ